MKDDEVKMTLRQLVRYHRIPTVLNILADLASDRSIEYRTARDARCDTPAEKRSYRRYAAAWETIAKLLRRCEQVATKKLKGPAGS